jgi:hypothetical protein
MWHQFQATMGLHMYDVDRQVSYLSKNALPDFVEKFAPFLGQVVRLQNMNDYLLSKVRNPDESPTYFHMLSNYSGDGN